MRVGSAPFFMSVRSRSAFILYIQDRQYRKTGMYESFHNKRGHMHCCSVESIERPSITEIFIVSVHKFSHLLAGYVRCVIINTYGEHLPFKACFEIKIFNNIEKMTIITVTFFRFEDLVI